MSDEIWVLGATGRTGRAVATRLHEAGAPLVLAGRDRERVQATARRLGDSRVRVGSLDAILSELAVDPPAVVVNTIGPFASTAAIVARACPPGTHYVDVANELPAVQAILDLDREAADRGSALVTGAGFGVVATESVLLALCEGRPPASRVRVDAVPSVAGEAGVIGAALAHTILDGIPAGGRAVRQGRLVSAAVFADAEQLRTPDGDVVTTASLPSGELLAAWRGSHADFVLAANSEAPSGSAARALMPTVSALFRIPGVVGFAAGRLARVKTKAKDRPRESSWARARVQWPSGEVREGWLRAGEDAMAFTAAAAAEVAQRLVRGEGQAGAHTPGEVFGPELAEAAGGEFLLGPDHDALKHHTSR